MKWQDQTEEGVRVAGSSCCLPCRASRRQDAAQRTEVRSRQSRARHSRHTLGSAREGREEMHGCGRSEEGKRFKQSRRWALAGGADGYKMLERERERVRRERSWRVRKDEWATSSVGGVCEG
jgi:hypothetical protein